MPTKMDHDESELLEAFEQGQLKSVATKSELAKFKAVTPASDGAPEGASCSSLASSQVAGAQEPSLTKS